MIFIDRIVQCTIIIITTIITEVIKLPQNKVDENLTKINCRYAELLLLKIVSGRTKIIFGDLIQFNRGFFLLLILLNLLFILFFSEKKMITVLTCWRF